MKTFTAFALREMGSQQRLVESSLCVCECLLGVSSLSGEQTTCVCVCVFPLLFLIFLFPLGLLRESFLKRGAVNTGALSRLPVTRACWTKLNPVVNTVGKENDITLCKSVIKRWLDDFSCFLRNVDLSL